MMLAYLSVFVFRGSTFLGVERMFLGTERMSFAVERMFFAEGHSRFPCEMP